jgi:hypothetical protein
LECECLPWRVAAKGAFRTPNIDRIAREGAIFTDNGGCPAATRDLELNHFCGVVFMLVFETE